jgi:WD40-like Beta Propeller Repeat
MGALITAPTWSPDGQRIAFESDLSDDYDIWTINADGTDRRDVSRDPNSVDLSPSWRIHKTARSLAIRAASAETNHGCDFVPTSHIHGISIYGTPNVDWLCGTQGERSDLRRGERRSINGTYGPDIVYGGAGGDRILAQDGRKDTLYGGESGTADQSTIDWALVDKTLDKRAGIDALEP